MRTIFLLLLIYAIIPYYAQAQSAAEAGNYYILKESPGVRTTSPFAYMNSGELLATSKYGNKYTLKAQYILSLRWHHRSFVTVGGFEVRKGLTKALVDYGFAEVLDTGRVALLRYDYTTTIPLIIPTGSSLLVGGVKDPHYIYLLRDSTSTVAMPAWAGRAQIQAQRAALQPYVARRPDLVAAIDSKQFNENSLPAIIRALNSGQPFVPPPPPPVYLGIE